MQGFNHLAMLADTECGGMSVFKPNAGSATRWAGSLPLISWLNETKTPLRRYDLNPAENVAQLDDGSTYHDFSFHEEQWDDVTDVDAACRPVAAFISTMEAGKKVTSSLALPMSLAIIDALKATTPVQAYSYNNAELTISGKDGDDLTEIAQTIRRILHDENRRRFVDGERIGHLEDQLICSILDPRFKLMNFPGCTAQMKTNAEQFLRENYKADWSPVAVARQEKEAADALQAAEKAAMKGKSPAEEEEEEDEEFCSKHSSDDSDDEPEPEVAPIFKGSKAELKKVTSGGLASFMSNFSNLVPETEGKGPTGGTSPEYEEVNRYLRLPQIPLQTSTGEDQDILLWWKDHAPSFPHLAKMARQFLAAPASSASAERLFSGAGKMHDDLKKATKEGTLEMQLFVAANYPDA